MGLEGLAWSLGMSQHGKSGRLSQREVVDPAEGFDSSVLFCMRAVTWDVLQDTARS